MYHCPEAKPAFEVERDGNQISFNIAVKGKRNSKRQQYLEGGYENEPLFLTIYGTSYYDWRIVDKHGQAVPRVYVPGNACKSTLHLGEETFTILCVVGSFLLKKFFKINYKFNSNAIVCMFCTVTFWLSCSTKNSSSLHFSLFVFNSSFTQTQDHRWSGRLLKFQLLLINKTTIS